MCGSGEEIKNGARRYLILNKLQRGARIQTGMNLNVFFLFHSNPGQPCHAVLPCSTSTLALALTRVLVLALTLGQGTWGMIVLNNKYEQQRKTWKSTSPRARPWKVWYDVNSRDERERNKEIGNRRQEDATTPLLTPAIFHGVYWPNDIGHWKSSGVSIHRLNPEMTKRPWQHPISELNWERKWRWYGHQRISERNKEHSPGYLQWYSHYLSATIISSDSSLDQL